MMLTIPDLLRCVPMAGIASGFTLSDIAQILRRQRDAEAVHDFHRADVGVRQTARLRITPSNSRAAATR
jgi:hypothetical protein